jgi:uncharacterized membrane protein YeaQ/YmgE (transglycosylase-associated protein family)
MMEALQSNHYVYLAVSGFVVGLVARVLMPGRDPMGIIMTTILGIAGSFAGAYSAAAIGFASEGTWQHYGVALAGSFVLLLVYKFIRNV